MQLRTSDLLFITAIVAMYATGYAYAPVKSFESIDLIWMTFPTLQMLLVMKSRRNLGKVGSVVRRWKNDRLRWAHLAFATIFLVACISSSGTEIDVTLAAGAMLLAHHLLFIFLANVTLGTVGMSHDSTLLLCNEYRFEMDEMSKRLTFRRRAGVKAHGFGHPYSGRVAIPAEHIDAVIEWAAAVNADGRRVSGAGHEQAFL